MKESALFITFLLWGTIQAFSQTATTTDSLSVDANRENIQSINDPLSFSGIKEYGGFILDMSLMNIQPPKLTDFKIEIPDASKDYSSLFRLNPDISYSQGLYNIFSGTHHYGFWGTTDNLQMGSFKLKNGMRLNTYGEYDRNGWKVPNPSALPWERNNFKGAFELKSANGAFGIRIEVERGNKSPF